MSKIQDSQVKSESELVADGGAVSQLINDSKIYVTGGTLALNKRLDLAIQDGDLGGGAGGGSFVWELNGDLSPLESTSNGISFYDFNSSDAQEVYALITVPDSYNAGDQIVLKDAKVSSASSSGNILMKTETGLIQDGGAIATTDLYESTNSEITISAANVLSGVGDMDLTDASGAINSVAVAAGDVLRVRLFRDFTNETASTSDSAKFLKFSANISFKG